MLEKTLESPLDRKKIKPAHLKGNQPWVFPGRIDAKTETPILWPPDAKSWLIGKDPDAGKDWRREEKGMTEDEMVGWHHWLDGHDLEKTQGDSEGQGVLVCCSPWGHKGSDRTERLSSNKLKGCLCREAMFWVTSSYTISVIHVSTSGYCFTAGLSNFMSSLFLKIELFFKWKHPVRWAHNYIQEPYLILTRQQENVRIFYFPKYK